jgi:hypothetical protein
MSADNARLVEAGISFILILYCLLIFCGEDKTQKKVGIFGKEQALVSHPGLCWITLSYNRDIKCDI